MRKHLKMRLLSLTNSQISQISQISHAPKSHKSPKNGQNKNGRNNNGKKKSRIRETKNLSTDADRRTDTILQRLRDLSKKK